MGERRLLTLLVICGAVPGVAAEAHAMTWAEARAAALRSAPELRVSDRRADVARAEVRAAGALGNPTFIVTSARETARLSTGVSVPLPLFGQRGAAVAAATADADAVVREKAIALNDLRWNATVAWIDTWEADGRARLLEAGAGDARRLLTIASERFQAGSSPRLDVVRATADRVRAEADAESARALVGAVAARLAVWVSADPLAPPATTGGPGVPAALPSLPALVQTLAHHPALEHDQAQRAAAQKRTDLERRLRLPIVNAELVVNVGDPTLADAQGNARTDVVGGAAFELPLLNARGGAIARAEAQGALAEASLSLDAAHLRADLADAFRRTQAAGRRARQLASSALPAMEEARAMTEESYRAGRADLVRVLEAQRAVLDARLGALEATATWARSFADLERAAGVALGGADAGDAQP
jgi:cobalt-zinc-cadmium efflux system outer membrane protein